MEIKKVSVVVPTYNEVANIEPLFKGIHEALQNNYEIVVVDDGDDGTSQLAESLGAYVVKGKHQGLGQAIIDGIRASHSDIAVVMDGDLSHPPSALPRMISPIRNGECEMTIGSRYCSGGSIVGWTTKRKLISLAASAIAFPVTFKRDNTSGYFGIRKSAIEGVDLRGDSWKTMLEVLVKAKPKAIEVPIQFVDRVRGTSKFDKKQVLAYLKHLFKLFLFKYQRFLKFMVVGSTGVVVNFGLTYLLTEQFHLFYLLSSALAVATAASSNYIMNHFWTFREKRANNPNILLGWVKYLVAIGVTELIYLGLMYLFTSVLGFWYMASAVFSLFLTFTIRFFTADKLIWGKRKI